MSAPPATKPLTPLLLRLGGLLAAVAVVSLALWTIHRELSRMRLSDLMDALTAIPLGSMLSALVFTGVSYLALTAFDYMGLRLAGRLVAYRRVALASFIAQAVTHSVGFAALTGTSLRYRVYLGTGVTLLDVAKVMVFCATTFALGMAALAAAATLTDAARVAAAVTLPVPAIMSLGGLLVVLLTAYTAFAHPLKRRLRLGRWSPAIPRAKGAVAQIALGAAELGLAAAALYAVLPNDAGLTFLSFLGIYTIAILGGLMSHVPGGLGVFEGAMVLLLPQVPAAQVLGAMLVYRMIYNILPLLLALAALGLYEVVKGRRARPTERTEQSHV